MRVQRILIYPDKMIRMIQSKSAAHAKAYFSQALNKSDYYINDQELQGRFTGLLADRLGISGIASKETFFELCSNINPATGGNLTPRTKEERTVGYDVNFHCPKSVSIIHALSNDDHILSAFEASVTETLKEIEADSMTRVRKGGKDENRRSGELIMAQFTHQTARAVKDNPPDMHLHQHAYIFNATYDPVEKKIKAGQFRDIKRDMPYYQSRYLKRLSDKLIDLGYDVRLTDKNFELSGIPKNVIDHFAKRTNEIGQFAKEHQITDIETLSELGARTRAKKQNSLTMQELRTKWRKQINEQVQVTTGEKDIAVRYGNKAKDEKIFAKDCVDHAIDHSFERASVIQDRRLLANSIQHSIGERHIAIEDIENAVNAEKRLIEVQQRNANYYTTIEVLAEEREMVQLARKGIGRFRPLYQKAPELKYDGQQGEAIAHILTSQDQTCIIRGVAGAGKTTSLIELERHIKLAGKETFIVTPMAKTAREQLPLEGFKNANTVASLLIDRKQHDALKDQVLIVDEAGQLGVTDLTALLQIADIQNCRLVLVGDTRQHSAVMRGDGLRIVNTIAKIPAAEVSKIYRQRSNPQYLAAVEDLSNGEIDNGFKKLDDMGAIITIDPMRPNKELVDDYIANLKKGKSTLIISPTHKQGQSITKDIRSTLQKQGQIGKKETSVRKLENQNYTDAEKQDWRKYAAGQTIQFTQNVPNIRRGSVWRLNDANSENVVIQNAGGEIRSLPLDRASAFNVYREREISIAKGDKIRITQGGFDLEKRRLDNGQTMDVVQVKKDGTIHLKNQISNANYLISKDFGHIDHDYYSTSNSAQGKTVDVVLISQHADTFTATNAKQFYVSCSRGKHSVHVYTDDKEKLLEHASQLGNRKSALELVEGHSGHDEHIRIQEQEKYKSGQALDKEKQIGISTYNSFNQFDDYEPRI